jgi:uncharacterized protein (TIGR00369 family)
MVELPEDITEIVNAHRGGFDLAMGTRFVSIKADELIAEMTIGEQHRQPYGLVHGGVYAGMIETLCSTAAALSVAGEGKSAVGLENTTSFLRATRAGTVRCVARPLTRGRRTQVWSAEIWDEQGRLLATGRVRLLVIERDDAAGGDVTSFRKHE